MGLRSGNPDTVILKYVHAIREEKKYTDEKNWSFSIFRGSADLKRINHCSNYPLEFVTYLLSEIQVVTVFGPVSVCNKSG